MRYKLFIMIQTELDIYCRHSSTNEVELEHIVALE